MTGLDALIKFAEIHDELIFEPAKVGTVEKTYYIPGIPFPMEETLRYPESHVMLRVPVFNDGEIEKYEDRMFIRYIPDILARYDADSYEWPPDWRDPRFDWPKYSRDPRLKNIRAAQLRDEPRMDFGPGVIFPKEIKLCIYSDGHRRTVIVKMSRRFTDIRDVNLANLEDDYRGIRFALRDFIKNGGFPKHVDPQELPGSCSSKSK